MWREQYEWLTPCEHVLCTSVYSAVAANTYYIHSTTSVFEIESSYEQVL